MLRITLKNRYPIVNRLSIQFKFFRDLGVSRWNSCKLLYKLYYGHTAMIQTLTNLKLVSQRFNKVESDAYSVGFNRDVYNVDTTLYNTERFDFIQNLKVKPYYNNIDAKIYISKSPE